MDKNEIFQDYINKITQVSIEVERKTGIMLDITIHKFGTYYDQDIRLGSLNDVNRIDKIKIYDVIDEYHDLEGMYDSIDHVHKYLNVLNNNSQYLKEFLEKNMIDASYSKPIVPDWSDLIIHNGFITLPLESDSNDWIRQNDSYKYIGKYMLIY